MFTRPGIFGAQMAGWVLRQTVIAFLGPRSVFGRKAFQFLRQEFLSSNLVFRDKTEDFYWLSQFLLHEWPAGFCATLLSPSWGPGQCLVRGSFFTFRDENENSFPLILSFETKTRTFGFSFWDKDKKFFLTKEWEYFASNLVIQDQNEKRKLISENFVWPNLMRIFENEKSCQSLAQVSGSTLSPFWALPGIWIRKYTTADSSPNWHQIECLTFDNLIRSFMDEEKWRYLSHRIWI